MQKAFEKIIEKAKERYEDVNPYVSKAVVEIVNQVVEEYKQEVCEWKFTKSVVDGDLFFSSGCNHKRFSDLHNFEYCPYCGKKIKVVE